MRKLIQAVRTVVQDAVTNTCYRGVFTNLNSKSVAIDCGANVGKITLKMAKRGATVFAFEPNPHAFRVLQETVKSYPKVTCINKAVWIEEGKMNLYFHQSAADDHVFWSFGSSLVPDKINVDKRDSIEVEVVDLVAFIEKLDAQVALLKMDVEGAECELLEKIIKAGLHQKIGLIVAETHDTKIPNQKPKTDHLRQLMKEENVRNIRLSWL